MKVNEIFYSLQGEGLLAGMPSVFIRLAGCPMRCWWCDTKYARDFNKGKELSISKIIKEVKQYNCDYVVVTGGEPMVGPDLKLRKELPQLLKALKKIRKHITIETSGIFFEPNLSCDLMSISPKLKNSVRSSKSDRNYNEPDTFILKKLIKHYNHQLKFVIDKPDDVFEVRNLIKKIGKVKKERVLLMPQAKTRKEFLLNAPMVADLCKQTGFSFCNRLQILLWNTQKGV